VPWALLAASAALGGLTTPHACAQQGTDAGAPAYQHVSIQLTPWTQRGQAGEVMFNYDGERLQVRNMTLRGLIAQAYDVSESQVVDRDWKDDPPPPYDLSAEGPPPPMYGGQYYGPPGSPYQNPYGQNSYQNPYGQPTQQNPYGSQYQNPYGQPGAPYQNPYGNPYAPQPPPNPYDPRFNPFRPYEPPPNPQVQQGPFGAAYENQPMTPDMFMGGQAGATQAGAADKSGSTPANPFGSQSAGPFGDGDDKPGDGEE